MESKGLCGLCVLLLMLSVHPSLSQDCSSSGVCGDAGPNDALTHRLVSTVRGVDAMDVCLLVSVATSMADNHRWLQTIVPLMEEQLMAMDIGTVTHNRYCLVQFGGRGRYLKARFLKAAGKVFFSSNDFVHARRQLRRSGDVADGYEAIRFTLNNALFREDPRVGTALLLTSNMGRSVLSTETELTRDTLFSLLTGHDVALNTAVEVTLSLRDNATVLGLHDTTTVSVLTEDAQSYTLVTDQTVKVTSSAGGTVRDYVTLSTATGGSSWPLDLLAPANLTVLTTFVSAFIAENGIIKTRSVEVCEQCECVQMDNTECQRMTCSEAMDQEECTCLANKSFSECVSPSPVVPTHESSILTPQPTQAPRPLLISGTLDQFPGGDVELNFRSTINRANYECLLVTNDTDTPPLIPCISPYYLKNVAAGQHKLLVIGKRKHSVGTRVFDFEIAPDDDTPAPTVTIHTATIGNDTVRVDLEPVGFPGPVDLHCSLDGAPFYHCAASQLVLLNESTTLLVVVAISSRGVMATDSMVIDRPSIQPLGHVMITITSIDSPDPFGRIRIRYNTSRADVHCLCRVNTTSVDCQSMDYLADPRVLGGGAHSLVIACMDSDSYIDQRVVKFLLTLPPTPPPGPLSCDVRVLTEDKRLIASYTCDRRVMATCQVSSLPPDSCSSPSGMYEVDISSLGPGPHVFILSVDDGFGKSLMKIIPFSVGTAHRRCCPVIVAPNSTLTQLRNSHLLEAQLDLMVAPGNCSLTEGFSYSINWGDGSSETGMYQTLSSVMSTRLYDSAGDYLVEVTYCNSPSNELNICCDSLTLPLIVGPH